MKHVARDGTRGRGAGIRNGAEAWLQPAPGCPRGVGGMRHNTRAPTRAGRAAGTPMQTDPQHEAPRHQPLQQRPAHPALAAFARCSWGSEVCPCFAAGTASPPPPCAPVPEPAPGAAPGLPPPVTLPPAPPWLRGQVPPAWRVGIAFS